MNRPDVLRLIESHQLAVYTAQQFASMLGVTSQSAHVTLNRLIKDGTLARVQRGRYCLPSADILTVASNIYPPSYISLWAALEYHGTTTQSPRIIDVINPVHTGKRNIRLETGRYTIRFIKTKMSNIFGFSKTYISNQIAFIADVERAIVDGLAYPGHVPIDEIADAIRCGIDGKKAMDYAVRLGKQAITKRLGYLLSSEGYDVDQADKGLSATYVPLDPSRPRRGKHDKDWRIIVNTVIE